MPLDHDHCYRAIETRDRRFDGWFVTAVRSTGIYCRPSCPAATPKRRNVEFFLAAATAQAHGYRACKRCRPDASPGSPEWNSRADVVARAMRLIADGLVDRAGVPALASRLGYSERQIHRLLMAEIGSGPLALARAQRAQTARILIETSELPMTTIAFAAGFNSIRQFNDTIRDVFASSPTLLRERSRYRSDAASSSGQPMADTLTVRLAVREPFAARELFGFLGARCVPGVEQLDGRTYRRSLRLPRGIGVMSLTADDAAVTCSLQLESIADAQAAVQRARRLLDLDADPHAIDARLSCDPRLAALVASTPGLRSPGHPDGEELLVRAILGQQVSVASANTHAQRLVATYGEPLSEPVANITRIFPTAETIAQLQPDDFSMPRARGAALIHACGQLASGELLLDAGTDRTAATDTLRALPGVGPWTAGYIAMRALGDPDVWLDGDVAVTHALGALGIAHDARSARLAATTWAPWRSYAVHHLWAAHSTLARPTAPAVGPTPQEHRTP